MQIAKITVLFLVCVIVLSILVAKISNLITVNYDYEIASKTKSNHQYSQKPTITMDSSEEHLLWFIQVSDIHISIFHDFSRIEDFRDFCNNTINIIKPAVVLASGDLTDSKTVDNMGSTQFIQEWQYYNEILEDTKVVQKTLWLDIRGNHDNFNVRNVHSEKSYFHKYSIQGKKHLRSYMYTINKGSDNYSFIAVDACLEPGPRRPFNFIGSVTEEHFYMLQQFETDSKNSNATIWFGHYPTSCIISPEPGIRHLMRDGVAYMCGHLHTLGGIVPKMYTLQHSGILELELGDWKENRLYRVAAIDHGVFSFTDVAYGMWPVILVTNPKHALFLRTSDQDIVEQSTHIRILVFAPQPLEIVKLKLNDGDWIECEHVNGALYVSKWDPSKYSIGINNVHVYAKDGLGNTNQISHPFSIDGTRMHFKLLSRIALMSDATKIFHTVFSTLVVVSTLPLIALRLLHILVKEKRIQHMKIDRLKSKSFIRKLWILSCVNKLFFPLILYPLYVTIGPWFIGEIIEDHIGAAFAWGTIVDGKLLPGAFSYFYGCVQLFWFHIPLILSLSHCLDSRFKLMCLEKTTGTNQIWNHLPCALLIFIQAVFAYFFWLAYGTMALVLGPLRTWSVLLSLYLWYTTSKLKKKDLHEACLIWDQRDYSIIVSEDNKHEL